jgi:hypothetical protein
MSGTCKTSGTPPKHQTWIIGVEELRRDTN